MISHNWSPMKRLIWLRGSGITGGATYETISGNPVSFTAKAAPLRKLSIAFSPVQDLHGQDAPWPAGGGKNLAPNVNDNTTYFTMDSTGLFTQNNPSSAAWNWSFTNRIITATLSAGTYTATFYADTLSTSSSSYMRIYDSSDNDLASIAGRLLTSGSVTFTLSEETTVGIIAKIYDGAWRFQIERGLSSTEWTPFSNICPISGWSSLGVEMRGKNLLHGTEYRGAFYNSGAGTDLKKQVGDASYTQTDNTITITGSGWNGCVFTTEVLPAGTYHIGFSEDDNSRVSAFVTDENLIVKSLIRNWAGVGSADTTVTLTESGRISMWIGCGSTGTATFTNLQVELGSTATAYVPYNPLSRSISISLGSTVYSGWVDAVTGQGEIDKVAVPLTGEMFFNYSSTLSAIYGSVTAFPHAWVERNGGSAFMFSDGDATTRALMPSKPNAFICGDTNGGNNKLIFVKLDGITTSLSNGRTFLDERYNGGNPVTVCYELATPIPIQLTPQEINSLAGDNTMFTPCDSLTVEYRSN